MRVAVYRGNTFANLPVLYRHFRVRDASLEVNRDLTYAL